MTELIHYQPGKTFYDAYQGARGNTLAKLAITGEGEQRKSALADLYGLDPEKAQAAQGQIKTNDEQDYSELVQSAKVMYSLKGRPEADMMWQRVAPKFSQKYGIQFNPTPQPSDWDAIEKIVQATGSGGKYTGAPVVVKTENGPRFARYSESGMEVTDFAPDDRYVMQTDGQGNVYGFNTRVNTLDPTGAGGRPQMPQVQQGADPMASGLDRINQTAQVLKFNGVPVEKINEWVDAEFAKLQGTVQRGVVEQAPAQAQPSQARVAVKPKEEKIETWGAPTAVTKNGKPAMIQISNLGNERERPDLSPAQSDGKLTDDMRKTSTLLSRMDFALNQIRDVERTNKPANRPGYGVAVADYLPESISNDMKSGDRQVVEAAQLDALDAALTLATGAAYTAEQLIGLRKSYFPQPNDDEATIKAKQARFENVIQSARVRAGNAAQTPAKPAGGTNGAPKVGDVVKGYQYLGGNPADPKSWKKQ